LLRLLQLLLRLLLQALLLQKLQRKSNHLTLALARVEKIFAKKNIKEVPTIFIETSGPLKGSASCLFF
jgi:hypothetical protein